MNSDELLRAAMSDNVTKNYGFLGVFSPDTLPVRSMIKDPLLLICNTEDSDLPGQHWIAIHKDHRGHGFYFDSYGAPPKLPEFMAIMDSCHQWSYNKTQVQSLGSTTCGQYCLFFVTHCSRGYSLDNIVELLDQDDDKFVNDAIVNDFVKRNFDFDFPLIDKPFLMKQIAKQLTSISD